MSQHEYRWIIQASHAHIREDIPAGAEVYTDTWVAYKHLHAEYAHRVVDHAECYVKDGVHTNGLENFWSLLKRTLKGTDVAVEPFHLFRYLDEQHTALTLASTNTATRADSWMPLKQREAPRSHGQS